MIPHDQESSSTGDSPIKQAVEWEEEFAGYRFGHQNKVFEVEAVWEALKDDINQALNVLGILVRLYLRTYLRFFVTFHFSDFVVRINRDITKHNFNIVFLKLILLR